MSEIVSIPSLISHRANSGWSEGACPQIPIYFPDLRQALIAIDNNVLTALFFSSKDSLDFYSKLDDVDNILSSTGNKVTVKNAFSVYTEIKNFVAVE